MELVKYSKRTNYIAFVLYTLIVIYSYFDTVFVGNFLETLLLLTAILILWVVLNSNKMFSTSYLADNTPGQIKRDQIKLLETNYLIILTGAWMFLLFSLSYLFLQISLMYSAVTSFAGLMTLMVLIYHLRNKERVIAKTKRINVKRQDIILNYFGLPLFIIWQYFMYLDSFLADIRIIMLPVIGIYVIYMTARGVIRLSK